MTVDQSGAIKGLRRRSLVTGAVWAVPVVAVVAPAPAFAASPCATTGQGTVNFASTGGNYTRSTLTPTLAGLASVPVSSQPNVNVAFVYAPSPSYSINSANMGTTGIFGASVGLTLLQTRNLTQTPFPTLTITFDRPVTNVVIPFKQFSWPNDNVNGYRDTVSTIPTPSSSVLGSDVIGNGTVGTPYRNATQGAVRGVLDPSIVATATYAGPLLAIAVSYYDTATSTNHIQQGIQIGNITFDTKPAGCIVI